MITPDGNFRLTESLLRLRASSDLQQILAEIASEAMDLAGCEQVVLEMREPDGVWLNTFVLPEGSAKPTGSTVGSCRIDLVIEPAEAGLLASPEHGSTDQHDSPGQRSMAGPTVSVTFIGADGFAPAESAIATARLYLLNARAAIHASLGLEAYRERDAWAEAILMLVSEASERYGLTDLLEHFTQLARRCAQADLGVLLVPDIRVRGRHLIRMWSTSEEFDALGGTGSLAETELARATIDLPLELDLPFRSSGPAMVDIPGRAAVTTGPYLVIPISNPRYREIHFLLANSPGRSGFRSATKANLELFADQFVAAAKVADGRATATQLAIYEERDRIARDLHDLIIQRLFAAGMILKTVEPTVAEPTALAHLRGVVGELDTTIRDLRHTIFNLQADDESFDPHTVLTRIDAVIEITRAALGFSPLLEIDGPLTAVVTPTLVTALLAVVREGLANVVRHAKATSVQVRISATAEQLTVTISDNGSGLGAGQRRSGLASLARRAQDLGGSLQIEPRPGGGTMLIWQVKVPRFQMTDLPADQQG